MSTNSRSNLLYDLFLPTLLFAVLGGMTWAVRGCSGFGGAAGCLFAGVTWGAAWWFIAHDPAGRQSRRYASAWIVLALAVGIGISGARGWMQWPSFFEGRLQTNASVGEFVPISRAYGFLWLFIAGVPWAGIGACMLAWCAPARRTRAWHWAVRMACGLGGAYLAYRLFEGYPRLFLPLFSSIQERYQDLEANPTLKRLINDNRAAIIHLGLFLGFLAYEIGRRDWKNVLLIGTVGFVNGVGWSLLQNWKWAAGLWPGVEFNWWRCWESSGGISIGIAYGLAYFLVNRRMSEPERLRQAETFRPRPDGNWLAVYLSILLVASYPLLRTAFSWGTLYAIVLFVFGAAFFWTSRRSPEYLGVLRPDTPDPNLERFGLGLGLLFGLGLSIRNGMKGWANIYIGNEDYWSGVFWQVIGPLLLLALLGLVSRILRRPLPRNYAGDAFPMAYGLMWTVLVTQNLIAQLVTGPHSEPSEVAFSIYYLVLFVISAVVVHIFHKAKKSEERLPETQTLPQAPARSLG